MPALLIASSSSPLLFYNLGNNTSAYRPTAFTDSKTEFVLQGDGCYQLYGQGDIVTGHNHLYPFRKFGNTGHVSRSQIELGTIAIEEGGMTTALFLGEDVNLTFELRMGVMLPGLAMT